MKNERKAVKLSLKLEMCVTVMSDESLDFDVAALSSACEEVVNTIDEGRHDYRVEQLHEAVRGLIETQIRKAVEVELRKRYPTAIPRGVPWHGSRLDKLSQAKTDGMAVWCRGDTGLEIKTS